MKNVKKTALSAILAALASAIIYTGSLFGKIDIAVSVIASVCVMITLAEFGYARAVAVYIVVSVLSFLVVPAKTAVMLFAVLFGMYPVVRQYSESRLGRKASYIAKYVYLNAAVAILFAVTFVFLKKIPLWVVAMTFAAANLLLPIYDSALSGLLAFYYNRIRNKIF